MSIKLFLPLLFIVLLPACEDTRTFVLEPEAREQLYTLKLEGGQSVLCGVDPHPLDPIPVIGLGPLDIEVGYNSYDNGGRAFCEIERGYEYHGELYFDLAPLLMAGVTEINTVTLTAHLRRNPENTCEYSDDPSAPIFAVALTETPPFGYNNDTREDVYPVEAVGRRIMTADGEQEWDYREWLTRGTDDIDEDVGINRLTAAMGDTVIEMTESELTALDGKMAYSVIGTANPNWRGERACLARLVDVQLLVVVPE